MRVALSVFRVILIVALVLILAVQGLVLSSLILSGDYPAAPLACTIGLLCVGIVLFYVLRQRRYIGLLLCTAAAVAFIFIAVDLLRAFPSTVQAYGETGLTVWKTIWRHGSPALIPLLMLPIVLIENKLDLQQQIRTAKKNAAAYEAILDENANLNPETVLKPKKKQIGIRIRK